jgi:hypothetical protein
MRIIVQLDTSENDTLDDIRALLTGLTTRASVQTQTPVATPAPVSTPPMSVAPVAPQEPAARPVVAAQPAPTVREAVREAVQETAQPAHGPAGNVVEMVTLDQMKEAMSEFLSHPRCGGPAALKGIVARYDGAKSLVGEAPLKPAYYASARAELRGLIAAANAQAAS